MSFTLCYCVNLQYLTLYKNPIKKQQVLLIFPPLPLAQFISSDLPTNSFWQLLNKLHLLEKGGNCNTK